jgi:hypothetical protein
MAAQEQDQAKTSATSSLPTSSERSSSSNPSNVKEGGRCRAAATSIPLFLFHMVDSEFRSLI